MNAQDVAGAIRLRRASVLPRRHLVNRLHAAVGEGLMVIQAPAGFGKTTLLTLFAAEVEFRVRWLTLDSSCRSREAISARIAAAVATSTGCPPPLTTARTDDLKAYLARILHEAIQAEPLPLMLFIDNAHAVKDEPECLDLLEWLLAALPEGAEVVIAGREGLSMPSVDRRLAGGQCLLLGRQDLTFLPEEVVALMGQGGDSPSQMIDSAAGWPIGVAAVLAGAAAPDSSRKLEAGAAWDRNRC